MINVSIFHTQPSFMFHSCNIRLQINVADLLTNDLEFASKSSLKLINLWCNYLI